MSEEQKADPLDILQKDLYNLLESDGGGCHFVGSEMSKRAIDVLADQEAIYNVYADIYRLLGGDESDIASLKTIFSQIEQEAIDFDKQYTSADRIDETYNYKVWKFTSQLLDRAGIENRYKFLISQCLIKRKEQTNA